MQNKQKNIEIKKGSKQRYIKKDDNNGGFYVLPVWVLVLAEMKDAQESYIITQSSLSESLGVTYAYINRIINKLLEDDLISMKAQGREKELFLTPKGENLAIDCLVMVYHFQKQDVFYYKDFKFDILEWFKVKYNNNGVLSMSNELK